MAPIIFVKSWPASPTKGSPWMSSLLPGASPMKTSSASGLPTPKTMFLRVGASLQRVHSPSSSRTCARDRRARDGGATAAATAVTGAVTGAGVGPGTQAMRRSRRRRSCAARPRTTPSRSSFGSSEISMLDSPRASQMVLAGPDIARVFRVQPRRRQRAAAHRRRSHRAPHPTDALGTARSISRTCAARSWSSTSGALVEASVPGRLPGCKRSPTSSPPAVWSWSRS
jgi:hypothetical protein